MMKLDNYRNVDGTLNLHRALDDMTDGVQTTYYGDAVSYIDAIQQIQPIASRQAGAIILVNALNIAIRGH